MEDHEKDIDVELAAAVLLAGAQLVMVEVALGDGDVWVMVDVIQVVLSGVDVVWAATMERPVARTARMLC